MLRVGGERDELMIVADQRGWPTSTVDLAEVILALAPRLVGGAADADWGTYHFTGEGETNWCQFGDDTLGRRNEWLGSRPKPTPNTTAEYPTAARRPMNSVLDNGL